MRSLLLSGLIALVIMAGCVTVPKLEEPIEKERIFNRGFPEVWDSTIEGLVRAGEVVSRTEKSSGLIVIEKEVSGRKLSSLIREYTSLFEIWQRGTVKANILIKPLSETSTQVFTNVKIEGMARNLQDGRLVGYCLSSNGTTEKGYLDLIERMLYRGKEFKSLEE